MRVCPPEAEAGAAAPRPGLPSFSTTWSSPSIDLVLGLSGLAYSGGKTLRRPPVTRGLSPLLLNMVSLPIQQAKIKYKANV